MLTILRWFGGSLLILALTFAIWLGTGLLRPLDPIPAFGALHQRIAITGATIIDIVDGTTAAAQVVLIDGGMVVNVGPASATAIPDGFDRVDATGKFMIPGLWDAHVHTLEQSPRIHFPLLLAHGVTAIRNMGDGCSWGSDLNCVPDDADWRAQGTSAARLVPYVAASASTHFEDPPAPSEIRAMIGSIKARGDTLVKLQLPDDVDPTIVAAIVAEARRVGLPVAGHIPRSVDLTSTALRSISSIEHGNQLLDQCEVVARKKRWPTGDCSPLLRQMARDRTIFVPTFVASTGQDVRLGRDREGEDATLRYTPSPISFIWSGYRWLSTQGSDAEDEARSRERHRETQRLTLAAHRAGVPVLAGSDALDPFVLHGVALHDELEMLVEAGFSPLDALRAATKTPANRLLSQQRVGRVSPGALADIVLLDANPLQSIAATRRVAGVYTRRYFFDRSELARMKSFVKTQAQSHALAARLCWSLLVG